MSRNAKELTIVILNLELGGDRIVDLLVLVLASPQTELALDGSGRTADIASELLGGFLRGTARSEEEISGSESGGSNTGESVRRDSSAWLRRGRLVFSSSSSI